MTDPHDGVPLRIAHVSTSEGGGAGRAAVRIAASQRAIGCNAYLLTMEKQPRLSAAMVEDNGALSPEQKSARTFFNDFVQNKYLTRYRNAKVSNTLFSSSYCGFETSHLRLLLAADVINLHWITRMLSPDMIRRLMDAGKKVVWTIHDQWPFTGGCHYSAGCDLYKTQCGPCPQLRRDPWLVPATMQADKAICLDHPNLVVVAPSDWMAQCARESFVFRNARVEVVRNPIDLARFAPLPAARRRQLRDALGLTASDVLIGFGATTGAEKRKGYDLLRAAMQDVERDLPDGRRLWVATFGLHATRMDEFGHRHVDFGKLDDDAAIAAALGLCDLVVLPSQEDNYPNVLLEALACGAPVATFDFTGMKEMVEDGVTGVLFRGGWDKEPIVDGLRRFFAMADRWPEMREAARAAVDPENHLVHIGRAYEKIYKSLLPLERVAAASTPCRSDESAVEIQHLFRMQAVGTDTRLGPLFGSEAVSAVWRPSLTEYHALAGAIENPDAFIDRFAPTPDLAAALSAMVENRGDGAPAPAGEPAPPPADVADRKTRDAVTGKKTSVQTRPSATKAAGDQDRGAAPPPSSIRGKGAGGKASPVAPATRGGSPKSEAPPPPSPPAVVVVRPARIAWERSIGVGDPEGPVEEMGLHKPFRWIIADKAEIVVETPAAGRYDIALSLRTLTPDQAIRVVDAGDRLLAESDLDLPDLLASRALAFSLDATTTETRVHVHARGHVPEEGGRNLFVLIEEMSLKPAA